MREFTATVYVLNEEHNALLFMKRRKPPFAGCFFPPGGHLEPNETPDEAAVREVQEETGYSIRLLSVQVDSNPEPGVVPLAFPINIQLERIDDQHDHIDYIYVGEVLRRERTEAGEEWMWLDAAQLDEEPVPAVIRVVAKRVLQENSSIRGIIALKR
ncbi:NUDIX hydrolase [Paenibacillus paeoniae]|uniref:NUDIX hydrolase n=1 Tax=Paenibacillus paeoniae TaxID=2292705 RepID=UPI0023E78063|nr:NUDIX domain-containing protein [Paenibacillus paeoniae]